MSRRASVGRAVRVAAAAVFALAVLAYGASIAGDWVFDDLHSIAGNPPLHDVGNVARFWVDPSTFSSGIGRMYRPALLTSFALNLACSPAAWACKAGNVLLHGAVAGLLFGWLWRCSRNLRASVVVAALFAVHPLASEAVNLVSARSEGLMLLGLLLALHCHLSSLRGGGAWAHAGAAAATVLACGSKETGAVVPFVCAAQAWLLRGAGRSGARSAIVRAVGAVRGVVPMLAVVACYLVARKLLLGEVAVPLLGRTGDDPSSGHGRSLVMQLATMGTLLPGCVLQAVWPAGITIDPPVTFRASFAEPAVLLGWGTMAALSALAAWPGPGARLRRLGLVLAWAVALPWIVVPLNMPLAWHRLYAPLAGFAAIAVAVAPRVRRVVSTRLAREPRPLRAAPAVAFALVLVAGVAESTRLSLVYRDERALWAEALAHAPDSFRSWWGLGTSRLRHGDVAGAIEPLAKAHALCPTHFDTLRNYAEALTSLPDADALPERALAIAGELHAKSPGDPWVRTVLAQAHLQAARVRGGDAAQGHWEAAERLALSCLSIAAPKGYVYQLAAAARRGLHDLPGALAHLDTSIARGLGTVPVRLERADVLRELGRAGEARQELLRAQRDAPLDPRVLHALQRQHAAPVR
jgi:hypothetical protein